MSTKEISRLQIMQRLKEHRRNQIQAAEILKISTRQVQRLLHLFLNHGASGLISKRRGKTSNNQLPSNLKLKALGLIETHYADFGPTLVQEKLLERHNIQLSIETIRKLMV